MIFFSMFFASMIGLACGVLEPDPRTVKLLAQADSMPDDASIVSLEQTILQILFASSLARAAQTIHSKHVGVHKTNRYGFGVSWARIHRLGIKIMRLGFSWNAASNIICVEGDGDSDSAEFTAKLQNSSEHFGKQKRHELKYFSLGGHEGDDDHHWSW